MKEDEAFKDVLERRSMAALAFMQADASDKLRRALLRRHVALKHGLSIGQRCYNWREGKTNKLTKNKWKGPAVVVFEEMRQDE
eukprot:3347806-Pyramimonas_sp.AAC.1